MIKTMLGYEIVEGVSAEEYERWLFEVHAPDLLANPHLDRIVFNQVLRPVTPGVRRHGARCREGDVVLPDRGDALRRRGRLPGYLDWFAEHPLPAERGPGGRTDFRFYLVTESTTVTR